MAGRNARQATRRRTAGWLANTTPTTKAPKTIMSDRNSAVLCGSSTNLLFPQDSRAPPWRADALAVEVGFEPTEGLPPHTLSRTAQRNPPTAASVPNLGVRQSAFAGERLRTGVNETKTEPRGWAAGGRVAGLPGGARCA